MYGCKNKIVQNKDLHVKTEKKNDTQEGKFSPHNQPAS